MDDTGIVDLFFERDESAITETANKYGSRLRALAMGIVREFETAEECENDTYLRAWNSIPPNEPREYFYPYLARITRNLSLNCCRDRERLKRNAFITELSREMEECIPSSNDTSSHMEEMELAAVINQFLQTLSKEKRVLFVRRYFFMESIQEIANRFGFSVSKVKTSLHRTRKALEEYLVKEGYIL